MSDNIFHEVDEEVRREQLRRLWNRYGHYVAALAVLVVVGVGAWRGYEYWRAQKAAAAGREFEAAMTLAEDGKTAEAQAAYQRIVADAPSGYRALARLREAAELAKTDPKAAMAAYDTLAADSGLGKALQDLAAIRSAFLAVDNAPFADVQRRLEPLADPGGTFRHTARELLATAAWRAGDSTALKRWSDAITNDAETPAAVRSRIEMLTALAPVDGKS